MRAGDHHAGPSLSCAECHVVHPLARGGAAPASDVGPLLKSDVNDLCLSCHDDSPRATDVLGRNLGSQAGIVRQAGALNRLGGPDPEGTGHTLDSLAVAPGSVPPWSAADEDGGARGLSCTHCHAAHGNEAYRNLRDDAGHDRAGEGLVTYNRTPGVNDPGRDVFVRRALAYDEADVDFNEPDRRDSAIGRFCAGCHGLFHGAPGDATVAGTSGADGRYRAFVRHPTAGVDLAPGSTGSLARLNEHANRVKVLSSSGTWSPAAADATPTCITCHKAHGNGNAFGLIFRSGRGALSEEGDSGGEALEDLCGQCHGEASRFATL